MKDAIDEKLLAGVLWGGMANTVCVDLSSFLQSLVLDDDLQDLL